jgi:hypothetical protein
MERLPFHPQELAVEPEELTGGQPILKAEVLRQKPDAGKRCSISDGSAK